MDTFTSHDGLTVPQVGFGTYKLNGEHGVEAMINAARIGYRLFDSAVNYENEGAVGQASRQIVGRNIAKREDLTVISKLPGRHHQYDAALTCIQESLYRTGLDYLDLYLIHWPNPLEDKYVEAWEALIEAQRRGYLKHIGVSNFLPEHLDRLGSETGVMPALNQIEMHPHFPQVEQLEYHKTHGIITQSWSPLARGNYLDSHQVLQDLANKYSTTVAQLVLRWHTQRGAMPIPRSSNPERQALNLDIFGFSMTETELASITALGKPDGRMKGSDPRTHQEF